MADLGTQNTKLFYPYVDFEITPVNYSGNPFDIECDIVFTHTPTQAEIHAQAFYDGDWDEGTGTSTVDKWIVRFTGTIVGEWTFVTSSLNNDLDGHTGTVNVDTQDNQSINGRIANDNPNSLLYH